MIHIFCGLVLLVLYPLIKKVAKAIMTIKTVCKYVNQVPQKLLEFLLPSRCVACRDVIHEMSSSGLCGACWQTVTFLGDAVCSVCGLPFEIVPETPQICGQCAQKLPSFSKARAAVLYDTNSKDLILSFKHGDATHLAPTFAYWMFQAAKRVPSQSLSQSQLGSHSDFLKKTDLIIPVPLHRLRLMKRGYNQASLLANALSNLSGIPTCHDLLIRTHNTKTQGHLSNHDRFENVKNKFTVLTKNKSKIKKKVITIVDDVFTSGATVTACADALKKAGAQEICVLTLARVAHL